MAGSGAAALSFFEAMLASGARAAGVATVGVVFAWLSQDVLDGKRFKGWWWGLLLSPVVMPGLLVGYAYADLGLPLARHAWASEGLYLAVLLARYGPVAAVAVALSPPPAMTPAAVHAARLGGVRVGWRAWAVHGPGRPMMLAWVVTCLLGFQEFELASLMVRPGWSVWLFDAQVVGLELGESLWYAAWPAGVSVVAVGAAVGLVWAGGGGGAVEGGDQTLRSRTRSASAWGWAGGVFLMGVAVPLGLLVWRAGGGWMRGVEEGVLGEEVRASLVAAGVSAAVVVALVWWLSPGRKAGVGALVARGPAWRPGLNGMLRWVVWVVVGAGCMVGLVGPLVLGLALVWLFQRPGLRMMYDTPVVWGVGLVVWLLPVGVVLGVLAMRGRAAGVHLGELLAGGTPSQAAGGRRIVWRLRGRLVFWGWALLVLLAFWDVTLAKLLAPVSVTPVSVMLYNLMHYGRDANLTARALLAAGAVGGAILAARVVVEAVRWGWGTRRLKSPRRGAWGEVRGHG